MQVNVREMEEIFGREKVRVLRDGFAIEFRDGFDAFILGHKDLQEQSLNQLSKTFHELEDKREIVILALKKWLIYKRTSIQYCRSGQWYQKEHGRPFTIPLGRYLTQKLTYLSPEKSLKTVLQCSWLSAPSANHLKKLFSSNSPSIKPKRDETLEFPLAVVIGKKFDIETTLKILTELKTKVKQEDFFSHHKELKVVGDLIIKIGPSSYSSDDSKPGFVFFEYKDGYDSLSLNLKDEAWKAEIDQRGIETIVNELESAFTFADKVRSEVLEILQTTMSGLGFYLDESDNGHWWFGKEIRQYKFAVGPNLTSSLTKFKPLEIVQKWLEENDLKAVPNSKELKKTSHRYLPPVLPQKLPKFRDYQFEPLKELAISTVENYKSIVEKDPDLLGKYWISPVWYRNGCDVWADDAWWKARAKQNDMDWILTCYGDHDAKCRLLEKAAIYKHLEPDVTVYEMHLKRPEAWLALGNWEQHQAYEDYEKMGYWPARFGPLPHQRARISGGRIWSLLTEIEETNDQDDLIDLQGELTEYMCEFQRDDAKTWFSTKQLKKIHEICMTLTQTYRHEFNASENEYLIVAKNLGFSDVSNRVESNPSLERALNTDFSTLDSGFLSLCLLDAGAHQLAIRLAAFILVLGQSPELKKECTYLKPDSWPELWHNFESDNYFAEQQFAAAICLLRWQKDHI